MNSFIVLSSSSEIQKEFCSCIEFEQSYPCRKIKKNDTEEDPGYLFLESREIQDYLALYGVKYVGNFLLESTWNSKWDELSKEEAEKKEIEAVCYMVRLSIATGMFNPLRRNANLC